jgi:hypothetical protein
MSPSHSWSLIVKTLAWLLGLSGVTACHHAPSVESPGRASFKFIEEPRRPSPPAKEADIEVTLAHERFVPAEAVLPLTTPIYPQIATKDRAGWTTISVQVIIDSQGRVVDIGPSRFGFSTPSAFALEFAAAIDAAVRQWKFRPAEVRHVQPVALKNGQTIFKVVRIERVETTFDVSFTFTAAGEVIPSSSR